MDNNRAKQYIDIITEELIKMAKEGDEYAMAELTRRMVLKTSRQSYMAGHIAGYRDGELA